MPKSVTVIFMFVYSVLSICHAGTQVLIGHDYAVRGVATQYNSFAFEFDGGLVFKLIPKQGGFRISVFPKDHPNHDYAEVITQQLPPTNTLDIQEPPTPRLATPLNSRIRRFLFVRNEVEYAEADQARRNWQGASQHGTTESWSRIVTSAAVGLRGWAPMHRQARSRSG